MLPTCRLLPIDNRTTVVFTCRLFFLLLLPLSPSPRQDNYGDRKFGRDHFGCGAVKLYREDEPAKTLPVRPQEIQGQGGLELRLLGTTPIEQGIARRESARSGDGGGDVKDHRVEPFSKKDCATKDEEGKSCKEQGDRCSSDNECTSGICYASTFSKRRCVKGTKLEDTIQPGSPKECYRDWQCSPTDGTEAYCHTDVDDVMKDAENTADLPGASSKAMEAASKIVEGVNAPIKFKQFKSGKCKSAHQPKPIINDPITKAGSYMDKTTANFNDPGPTTALTCSDVVPALMSVLAKKVERHHDWSKFCVIRSTTMGDPTIWNYDWRRRNGA